MRYARSLQIFALMSATSSPSHSKGVIPSKRLLSILDAVVCFDYNVFYTIYISCFSHCQGIKKEYKDCFVISPVVFNLMINYIFQKVHRGFGVFICGRWRHLEEKEILVICSVKLKKPWIRLLSGQISVDLGFPRQFLKVNSWSSPSRGKLQL